MYESHFGLTDKPFKLSPEPRFFFSSPHHEKALSYLQYGLSQGEGFIVVTGPIGTGKTTLARSLLASLDDSFVAIQIATTRLSPEELVRLVAAKFDIPVEGLDKADILKRMEQYLLALYQQGKRALLIVDEAQNLPAETVEELRMLSNFQLDDTPLIQSFLLGQEELKGIIALPDMEQFRQRIIASCHLQAFDSAQTKEYILHRLEQVGWDNSPELDSDIFELITSQSCGIPRKINILMDRVLLFAYLEDLSELKPEHIEQVLEEMGTEFSGSLSQSSHSQPAQAHEPSRVETVVTQLSDHEVEKLHKTLQSVTEVLDSVIERKVATIRYLDKLIIKKKRQVNVLPDDEQEKILDEDVGSLGSKYWVKQLMTAGSTESES
ncbi:general secretion pathway protein GspA [Photobacterium sanctipauli]|uniref:General secretion pathway protein GspA n=1 Tax=Photobacterium sanctipauli TaxID=1342794 RepID=A0A2T3NY93_9GAMM|nr:XrtA/PEP-CTERM system-associated ATPase [Photobacterium sanctipauli]PSW21220.1 general secretion pathway protein GspA [Photobacterium sanctipauli]